MSQWTLLFAIILLHPLQFFLCLLFLFLSLLSLVVFSPFLAEFLLSYCSLFLRFLGLLLLTFCPLPILCFWCYFLFYLQFNCGFVKFLLLFLFLFVSPFVWISCASKWISFSSSSVCSSSSLLDGLRSSIRVLMSSSLDTFLKIFHAIGIVYVCREYSTNNLMSPWWASYFGTTAFNLVQHSLKEWRRKYGRLIFLVVGRSIPYLNSCNNLKG